jgi:hypothetical protein
MKIAVCAAALAMMIASLGEASASPNLLINGGFEDGDFTGWTLNGDPATTFVTEDLLFNSQLYVPAQGAFFAALGANGAEGTLTQTFVDTPGDLYFVSFLVASDGDEPNNFGVTGPGSLELPLEYLPASDYVAYTGYFTGSGSDTIMFTFRNDPGYLSLDAVSVTFAPEPSTWAMMLLGFAGIGYAGYRRSQSSAAAS